MHKSAVGLELMTMLPEVKPTSVELWGGNNVLSKDGAG